MAHFCVDKSSESRNLVASFDQLKDGWTQGQFLNYKITSDGQDKVFLLAGRYGLAYCGVSFDSADWTLAVEIQKLEQKARTGQYSVDELAEMFAGWLKEALPQEMHFGFHLAAYNDYVPEVAVYPLHPVRLGYSGGVTRYGLTLDGETRIIRKLLGGEKINFHEMSLRDAIEFAELTVTVGFAYQRWFESYNAVSGGPVDILILTPNWSGFVKHKTLALFDREIVSGGEVIRQELRRLAK